MHESEKWKWSLSVVSDSSLPHRQHLTRFPGPWDSPGKNTGVGCPFLLQCRKVKSESEVAQSCPTLRDPMDCSPPCSSVHGIFQARVLEWGAISFSNGVRASMIKKKKKSPMEASINVALHPKWYIQSNTASLGELHRLALSLRSWKMHGL